LNSPFFVHHIRQKVCVYFKGDVKVREAARLLVESFSVAIIEWDFVNGINKIKHNNKNENLILSLIQRLAHCAQHVASTLAQSHNASPEYLHPENPFLQAGS
jgi:hypothetical protein